jgi:uncharacterized membrane protein
MAKAQTLATAFGGLSSAIGVWYAVAPRHFLQTIGIRPTSQRITITRLVAAQEMSVGGALLTDGRAGRWLAMRVAGDAVHGAMLALATRAPDNDRRQLRFAWAAWLGITVADIAATLAANRIEVTGAQLENGPGESSPSALAVANGAIHRSVTIQREPQEVYDFWRQLENLPQFMKHLERVDVIDEKRSHWVAKAPIGTAQWDAEITQDDPGRVIAWTSTGGSAVWNRGQVRFDRAPGDRGTEVHVELEYAPPAGPVGGAVARLMGEEPSVQIAGDLRRLKSILETGEIVVSEATVGGRSRRQRPARPIEVAA